MNFFNWRFFETKAHKVERLFFAAQEGRAKEVKDLLNSVNPNEYPPNQDKSPLMVAALNNHEFVVREFLQHKDISLTGDEARLIFIASQLGHTRIVYALLDHVEVNINQIDEESGYTPLSIACEIGNVDIVKVLLRKGADPNLEGRKGSPLMIATERKREEIVQELLGAKNIALNRAFMLACSKGLTPIVRIFLKHRQLNLNHVDDESGFTPFTMACSKGHRDVVKVLLDHGDLNRNKVDNLASPLSRAIQAGQHDVVKELLEAPNMNLNLQDQDGSSPLMMAVKNNRKEVVALLLDKCAADPNLVNVNLADGENQSPLFVACANGFTEIVRMLLDNKEVNLDQTNGAENLTAFAVACEAGHSLLIAILINRVNPNHPDSKGRTSLFRACEKKNRAVIRQLLEHDKVKVNDATHEKKTPLYLACEQGDAQMVHDLIKRYDINLDEADIDGRTPLWVSASLDQALIVQALVESGKPIDIEARTKGGVNDWNGKTAMGIAALLGFHTIAYYLYDTLVSRLKQAPNYTGTNFGPPPKRARTEMNIPLAQETSSMTFPMEDLSKATNNFSEDNKIGSGGCGDVFKGILKHLNYSFTLVAIKRLSPDSMASIKHIMAEISTLSKYRHPYLVTLLGQSDLSEPRPCLIYQYLPQGSLRDRLDRKNDSAPLRWETRIKIAWQAATALAFLHRPHSGAHMILHLDVKSENILLDTDYDVKVSDFGLARHFNDGKANQTMNIGGTPGYLCPSFCSTGIFSEKIDVFAFGVVMGELLTGKPVKIQGPEIKFLHNLLKGDYLDNKGVIKNIHLDPSLENKWPQESYEFFSREMVNCLDADPNKRPTMDQLVMRLNILMTAKQRSCIICESNPTNIKIQCGHAVICELCYENIRKRGGGCPLCSAPITAIQRGVFDRTYIP